MIAAICMIFIAPFSLVMFGLYLLYWKIMPLSFDELVTLQAEINDPIAKKIIKEKGVSLTMKHAASLGFPRKCKDIEALNQRIDELIKMYQKELKKAY